jgi:predicted small lipoprotein YifL
MKLKHIAVLALAAFALAACGLRDNPGIPPAHNQVGK